MNRIKIKGTSLILLIVFTFCAFSGLGAQAFSGETVTAFSYSSDSTDISVQTFARQKGDVKVSSRIYELLFGKQNNKNELYLIPSGDVFGIRIKEEFVTVNKAQDGSALRRGDKIISVNGIEIKAPEDVTSALSTCRGGAVKIDIVRGGEKMTLTVIPKYEDGTYKLGVTLRASASGIGTVTFIEPNSKVFGGLGHGVCDAESGSLVTIESGEAVGVVLGGLNRGEVGKPGELSGILSKKRIGTIETNNECGVFGVFENYNTDTAMPIPVGTKSELRVGDAEIISTVKNGKKAKYKIEITEIDITSTGSKSFKIKVTDPSLIAITGGIIRGMSGSPIIQDGKLVGAVTHVMVADPTEGYGIFIENMLNASVSTRNELPAA